MIEYGTVNIQMTGHEALLMVTALGTFQNRIGQHSSWAERKRIPTLDRMLGETEDDEEKKIFAEKKDWTRRYVAQCVTYGMESQQLKERIKAVAGITDEKLDKVCEDYGTSPED